MLIIGLTGGIATGKSTVTRVFKEHYNLPVVDCDLIAREVVEPGKPAYNKIVKHFNKDGDLLNADGTLNRPVLGQKVFGNEKERRILNGLIHPAIRFEMFKQTVQHYLHGASILVWDVPLLFESKLDFFCGHSLFIGCDEEKQLERLLNRDTHLTKEDAQKRIASQIPGIKKQLLADTVVDNSGSLEALEAQIAQFLQVVRPSQLRTLVEQWVPPLTLVLMVLWLVRNYVKGTRRRRQAKI